MYIQLYIQHTLPPRNLSPRPSKTGALQFGAEPEAEGDSKTDKPYQKNPYAPNPNAETDKAVYTFKAPEPNTLMQRVLLSINRRIMLPWVRKIKLELPPKELAKLRAIPKEAGNIFVGPHPDNEDGGLMFDLYRQAGKVPAGFFIGSEVLVRQSHFVQKLMDAAGGIPVARGKSNPEATAYLTDKIAKGGWGGIFPEGTVYISRQVMPMEYGAIKIGMEAALKAEEEYEKRLEIVRLEAELKAKKAALDIQTENGSAAENAPPTLRPIFVTPFAHVYYHTNMSKMIQNMDKALADIEKKPEIFGKKQPGTIKDRMKNVALQILSERARRYGINRHEFEDADIFISAHKLEKRLLEDLEMKYKGSVQTGFSRRRAIKIKMIVLTELNQKPITDDRKKELKLDLQKTQDVAALTSFDREYMNQYDDVEMWGEFLRRLRDMVGLNFNPFGRRRAVMHMLPSIDMHQEAANYKKLETDDDKQHYLFDLTEKVRQQIQAEVNKITRSRPAPKIDF
jgi:1-acyl-sn-glycerol-3-phosphate acyltransferase